MDAVTFNLFNSLEDWRVEKRLSAIFPGCRQNLNRLIRKFFVDGAEARAGAHTPARAVLDYVLLTVRAWDVQEVAPRRMVARDPCAGNIPVWRKRWMRCWSRSASIARTQELPSCTLGSWRPVSGNGNPGKKEEVRRGRT